MPAGATCANTETMSKAILRAIMEKGTNIRLNGVNIWASWHLIDETRVCQWDNAIYAMAWEVPMYHQLGSGFHHPIGGQQHQHPIVETYDGHKEKQRFQGKTKNPLKRPTTISRKESDASEHDDIMSKLGRLKPTLIEQHGQSAKLVIERVEQNNVTTDINTKTGGEQIDVDN